jgi:hypothetical protein
VAGVPVGFEAADARQRQWGNNFGSMTTSLATDIADPWERLLAIAVVSAVAKRDVEAVAPEVWQEWLDTIPPFVMRAFLEHHHRHRRNHREIASLSVTVSNVRGPSRPFTLGPAVAEEVYLNGPPNNGVGSVVALFSHGDSVNIGTVSVSPSMPDPALFVEGLRSSLAELVTVAMARRGTPAGV